VAKIAATAVVDKTVELGAGALVGPGCVVEAGVVIGDDCELVANVMVCRGTRLGRGNRLFAGCVLGEAPQILGTDRAAAGELIIGEGNTFRECVTISRGSLLASGRTTVGNNNYLMAYSHLGHDVVLEDQTTLANCCQVSGHCRVERNVWLSGYAGTHQFVTIGRFAYAAGYSAMASDVPPFLKVSGNYPCIVRGLNRTGLLRAGFAAESIQALERAYRLLYRRKDGQTLAAAAAELARQDGLDENVRYLLESVQRSMQQRQGRYQEQFRR